MKNNSKTILSIGTFVFFTFIAFGSGDDKKNTSSSTTNSTESTSSNYRKIGEALSTEYFNVIVNKVRVMQRVNTGNEFADLKEEEGNKYLVINVTFKNTSNESRILTDGEILINYNGKDYIYDKSETIMLEGWGLLLDQINPLISKTTNLVYKIPAELKGIAYYKPGRSGNNDLIVLGNIE